MGQVGHVGPAPSLITRLGVPGGGVSVEENLTSCSIVGFWRCPSLMRVPLSSTVPEASLLADNRVFHADLSLTYR